MQIPQHGGMLGWGNDHFWSLPSLPIATTMDINYTLLLCFGVNISYNAYKFQDKVKHPIPHVYLLSMVIKRIKMINHHILDYSHMQPYFYCSVDEDKMQEGNHFARVPEVRTLAPGSSGSLFWKQAWFGYKLMDSVQREFICGRSILQRPPNEGMGFLF